MSSSFFTIYTLGLATKWSILYIHFETTQTWMHIISSTSRHHSKSSIQDYKSEMHFYTLHLSFFSIISILSN